jgi:hypothetical protein
MDRADVQRDTVGDAALAIGHRAGFAANVLTIKP